MAPKQAPALIVAVALLIAAVTPIAYGQGLGALRINGIICCTSTGNCPPGSVGVPGVRVGLNCTTLLGSVVTLAQNVTTATGVFSLNVNSLLGRLGSIIGGILPCGVFVNLPLNNTICPIFNTANGVLAGVPTLLNTVLDPVLGLVGTLSVPLFVNITAG